MLVDKLNLLLKIASAINCKVQIKLKILKSYIHSQILFELKTYSFPVTWVEQNFDNICFNFVRTWTEQPICSCVKESASLPKNEGGINIPTIKSLSEKMLLLKRNALKNSKCSDISLLVNIIWNIIWVRHNEILVILMRWLTAAVSKNQLIFADLLVSK